MKKMITSRMKRGVGHVVCMGEMINVHKIMVRKAEVKRPLGRP
jgi:hypothetical protein